MGRKSKYTSETVKKITQAIELGATYELAAGYGGISVSTFNEWRNSKPAFSAAIKEAEGRASVKWLARIEAAASEHWQAAAWKLERRYPKDYGRSVQQHEVSGADGGPLTIVFGERPDGPQ